MAIKINLSTSGKLEIVQEANLLTIYLDTWAWDEIANDQKKAEEFKQILYKKNGTLLLSWVTFYELCIKNDNRQIINIKNLLMDLDIAIININIIYIISKEKEYTQDGVNIQFPFDQSFCSLLITCHNRINPFEITRILDDFKNNPKGMIESKQYFNSQIQPLINSILKARNDPQKLEISKRRFQQNKKKKLSYPCTEHLHYMCLDFLVINSTMKLYPNDWTDIFHTIVPVSYAKFVLLDSRWTEFIKQTGLQYPLIAKVFNPSQITLFFEELRQYAKPIMVPLF